MGRIVYEHAGENCQQGGTLVAARLPQGVFDAVWIGQREIGGFRQARCGIPGDAHGQRAAVAPGFLRQAGGERAAGLADGDHQGLCVHLGRHVGVKIIGVEGIGGNAEHGAAMGCGCLAGVIRCAAANHEDALCRKAAECLARWLYHRVSQAGRKAAWHGADGFSHIVGVLGAQHAIGELSPDPLHAHIVRATILSVCRRIVALPTGVAACRGRYPGCLHYNPF